MNFFLFSPQLKKEIQKLTPENSSIIFQRIYTYVFLFNSLCWKGVLYNSRKIISKIHHSY